MTLEEMKAELEKAGYSIHEKTDEKLLDRRTELYGKIFDCVLSRKNQCYRHTGRYVEIYCLETYAQNLVRKKTKEKYGTTDYSKIPDEEWPEAKKELLSEAQAYINRKYEKVETRL